MQGGTDIGYDGSENGRGQKGSRNSSRLYGSLPIAWSRGLSPSLCSLPRSLSLSLFLCSLSMTRSRGLSPSLCSLSITRLSGLSPCDCPLSFAWSCSVYTRMHMYIYIPWLPLSCKVLKVLCIYTYAYLCTCI